MGKRCAWNSMRRSGRSRRGRRRCSMTGMWWWAEGGSGSELRVRIYDGGSAERDRRSYLREGVSREGVLAGAIEQVGDGEVGAFDLGLERGGDFDEVRGDGLELGAGVVQDGLRGFERGHGTRLELLGDGERAGAAIAHGQEERDQDGSLDD